jgi:hypothetical protein
MKIALFTAGLLIYMILLPSCRNSDLSRLSRSLVDSTFSEIHFVPATEEKLLVEGWLRDADTLPRAVDAQLKIGLSDAMRHILFKFDLTADGWEAWVCLHNPGDSQEHYGYYLIPVHPKKEKFGEIRYLTAYYQDCSTKIKESWVFDVEGEKEIVTKELLYELPDGQCDSEEATFPTIRTTVFHFVNGKFEKGQTKAEPNIHKKMSSVPSMIERYKEEGYGSMIPEGWE